MAKSASSKSIETIKHEDAKRRNIPTAEFQSVLNKEQADPIRVAYELRNRDLDPQLVWRGKDVQDWSDLVVHAPPLYIQEKIHPKALIDDLMQQSEQKQADAQSQMALFADFNGLPSEDAKTEFYQHDQNWSNRMILGDSLQVMASLAEREGLRGKVQCIYLDPPYGIKFNSNFQWSTTSRDVKDGNAAHITREPEQVKAFRDTWRDGIHSYLTYLRDRLTVARDLLHESGSIFVQIGDENLHRVRTLLEEVFGDENYCATISFRTTGAQTSGLLAQPSDFILWFAKNRDTQKFRRPLVPDQSGAWDESQDLWIEDKGIRRRLTNEEKFRAMELGPRIFRHRTVEPKSGGESTTFALKIDGEAYSPKTGKGWSSNLTGMTRLLRADRLMVLGKSVRFPIFFGDFGYSELKSIWSDTMVSGFAEPKVYVVQTALKVAQRCILMTTDPGDLVLDPTCGSGTTVYVAEQWGRRWITIDTSRVALALARARLMGARYPFYLLADSREGQLKEAEVTRTAPSSQPVHGNLRHGFVYERVPHITLKSIANNTEIDVIWEKWQATLEPLRAALNTARKQTWQEWEIPRQAEDPWPDATAKIFYLLRTEQARGDAASAKKLAEYLLAINHILGRTYTLTSLPERPADSWPDTDQQIHAQWWQARIARQREIDASIAAKADFEYLYDKPYENKKIVRVAGTFTVESVSPHRMLGVDENDELIDPLKQGMSTYGEGQDFVQMILEALKVSGVQQAHKEGHVKFATIAPWPGKLICAEGRYLEGEGASTERRAAIFIGPEFGTVTRADLVEAGHEALEARFDVLIACAFNFEAHTTEFNKLVTLPVLKARMNADLHMADALKNTGKGNLFVVFGEPDIEFKMEGDKARIRIRGVDVFNPSTGEVESDDEDGIACWFIDTDYNGESFFVRHAYFLGANDPYGALKTTLKAEINEDAWASLHSAVSRPFGRPSSGRIAVKVINHLGDEAMKVFRWPGDAAKR
jgi:adenine-specific DNA-methyltransferase